MAFTYAQRKKAGEAAPHQEIAPAQPSMDALRSGAAAPTQEQMGHRVDLPEAMREKMESAFGADLSAVKLYESEAVAEAGANAVTRGSDIAFAPGMLDFSSFGGQALLGHELSHVVSQARGEVTGGGFLNDASLEARADREGAMAAAGQTVSLPTAAMSGVTAAAAAGPMQADKAEEKAKKHQDEQVKQYLTMLDIKQMQDQHFNERLESGADFAARDPVEEKLYKQMSRARRKAHKAWKWEEYWNNKLDSRAEKRGEKSAADRGAVGRMMVDAITQRNTNEEGYLDRDAFKAEVKTGEKFMHRSDTSLPNVLDVDTIQNDDFDFGGAFETEAYMMSRQLAEERIRNLSGSRRAEYERMENDPRAKAKAYAKTRARYRPMKNTI